MEVNEVPKGNDEGTSPEIQDVENKELEIKASELAKETRQNGMGEIYISQRRIKGSPPHVHSFIQGEETIEEALARTALDHILPYHIQKHLLKNAEHRQIWMISEYVPPMEEVRVRKIREIKRKKFGFIPQTDRIVEKAWQPTDTPLTYHGKKGEPDWIQFDYYMPLHVEGERRHGSFVIMSIAVPPHVATKIDEQVSSNVYFPDAFFKALYPEYVGPDITKDLKRIQATELQIEDRRKGKDRTQMLSYPQPIPY